MRNRGRLCKSVRILFFFINDINKKNELYYSMLAFTLELNMSISMLLYVYVQMRLCTFMSLYMCMPLWLYICMCQYVSPYVYADRNNLIARKKLVRFHDAAGKVQKYNTNKSAKRSKEKIGTKINGTNMVGVLLYPKSSKSNVVAGMMKCPSRPSPLGKVL